MPLYGSKEYKLRRSTKKKQEYLTFISGMRKDGKLPAHTPTFVEWVGSSKDELKLRKAGLGTKVLRRIKTKKPL